jgi:hypothetical protein
MRFDRLPTSDAAFYGNARDGMAKIGETIAPPRRGCVRRSGGALLPHRQH